MENHRRLSGKYVSSLEFSILSNSGFPEFYIGIRYDSWLIEIKLSGF